ncbi:MAG: NUDIX domain-containing protein [Flavisolibacter sp.]
MRKSAGILLYRIKDQEREVFLVHPGGPFWKGKDKGAWSIPKGEFVENEKAIDAARREFEEETGKSITGELIQLNPIKQKGGKLVLAWAVEGDIDAENITSNTYKLEWPYKSGKFQNFPEVDKAGWFTIKEAKEKINPAQVALIDDLLTMI